MGKRWWLLFLVVGAGGCALTVDQALRRREPTKPRPAASDLDRVYAAAIRRALQANDLPRQTGFASMPRVIVMKDPSSLDESVLPADVGVPFLLLDAKEI